MAQVSSAGPSALSRVISVSAGVDDEDSGLAGDIRFLVILSAVQMEVERQSRKSLNWIPYLVR